MSFNNKVVIVTGASGGIGATTAVLFAKQGANVTIVGRNETKLQNVAAEIEKEGQKPLIIKADVSNDEDAKRIIEETVNKFGKIDVLVNNAGMLRTGSLLDGKVLQDFDYLSGTNIRAVINLTMLAVPHLSKTKGNVINISSVASFGYETSLMAYSITKAALDHFTKLAAKELATVGVRVNSINPGPVKTDIMATIGPPELFDILGEKTALKRVSVTEEIGEFILFIAHEKSRGVTGSILVSDNGVSLYPTQDFIK